ISECASHSTQHSYPPRRSADPSPGHSTDHRDGPVEVLALATGPAEQRLPEPAGSWRAPPYLPRAGLRLVTPPTAGGHDDQPVPRSEEHTSELQSREHLVCRLLH